VAHTLVDLSTVVLFCGGPLIFGALIARLICRILDIWGLIDEAHD
jgi:hypothetical protein